MNLHLPPEQQAQAGGLVTRFYKGWKIYQLERSNKNKLHIKKNVDLMCCPY